MISVVLLSVALALIVPMTLPHVANRYTAHPWGLIFPLFTMGSLIGAGMLSRTSHDARAFLCSCGYVVGMLVAAAFGHYPYLLPAIGSADAGLTIFNASTSIRALSIALFWFVPGMMLATAYFVFAYRNLLSGTAESGQRRD